jgi:uncharacterized membrane protein (DUF106 family)
VTTPKETNAMRKKSITIWVLTSLTFIFLVHFVEALTVIVLNNPIRLPQVYPFIGEALTTMSPITYFYLTAAITSFLWGITCLVAFHNPVEVYLNKNKANEAEFQEQSSLIDRMCDTVESDHHTLSQLKDLMRNIQAEVKEMQNAKQIKPNSPIQMEIRRDTPPQLKTPFPPRNAIHPSKVTATNQKTQTAYPKEKAAKKTSAGQKIKVKTPAVHIRFPLGKKK